MLRLVLIAVMMASALCAPQSNFIFKNDITPEEAQGYLNSLPFNEPVLSGRTAVLPLVRYDDPRFRSVEAGPTLGHYWKNGREIENTEDYVEEVYNAAQYHGQDGLGQYAYGYETPESSKVENRQGSGLTSGSYIYRAPNNDIVKVKYWADSQGFHQEDNLPKVELKPAEETPALREARLAFEKAWKEAAEANKRAPVDPYAYQGQASQQSAISVPANAPVTSQGKAYGYASSPQYQQQQYDYKSEKKSILPLPIANGHMVTEHKLYDEASLPLQFQQQQDDYQGQASEAQLVSVAAPNGDRAGKAYNQVGYSQQYNQQQQYNQKPQYNQQPQYSQQQQYNQQPQYSQQQQYNQQQQNSQQQQYGQQKYGEQNDKLEEPEPTGPPHGFFYSFNYPVSIIVPKNEHNPNGLPTQ